MDAQSPDHNTVIYYTQPCLSGAVELVLRKITCVPGMQGITPWHAVQFADRVNTVSLPVPSRSDTCLR